MASTRILGAVFVALFAGIVAEYALSIAVPYQLPNTSTPKPEISLSKDSVKVGEQYTVTLTGFPANTEIYGWTVNENPPKMFSAGTTDANGRLEVSGKAPETPGTWLLVACDKGQNTWATTIEVTAS